MRKVKLVGVSGTVVATLLALLGAPPPARAETIWFITPLYRAPDNTLVRLGRTVQGRHPGIGLVAATDVAAAQSGRLAWGLQDKVRGWWIIPKAERSDCIANYPAQPEGLHFTTCVLPGRVPIPQQLWEFYVVLGNGTAIKRPPQSSETNRYQIRSVENGFCLAINPASRYAVGVSALMRPCSTATVWRLHANYIP